MLMETMEQRLKRFCPPGMPPNAHLLDMAQRLDRNRSELAYLEGIFVERLILDLTESNFSGAKA